MLTVLNSESKVLCKSIGYKIANKNKVKESNFLK